MFTPKEVLDGLRLLKGAEPALEFLDSHRKILLSHDTRRGIWHAKTCSLYSPSFVDVYLSVDCLPESFHICTRCQSAHSTFFGMVLALARPLVEAALQPLDYEGILARMNATSDPYTHHPRRTFMESIMLESCFEFLKPLAEIARKEAISAPCDTKSLHRVLTAAIRSLQLRNSFSAPSVKEAVFLDYYLTSLHRRRGIINNETKTPPIVPSPEVEKLFDSVLSSKETMFFLYSKRLSSFFKGTTAEQALWLLFKDSMISDTTAVVSIPNLTAAVFSQTRGLEFFVLPKGFLRDDPMNLTIPEFMDERSILSWTGSLFTASPQRPLSSAFSAASRLHKSQIRKPSSLPIV